MRFTISKFLVSNRLVSVGILSKAPQFGKVNPYRVGIPLAILVGGVSESRLDEKKNSKEGHMSQKCDLYIATPFFSALLGFSVCARDRKSVV